MSYSVTRLIKKQTRLLIMYLNGLSNVLTGCFELGNCTSSFARVILDEAVV